MSFNRLSLSIVIPEDSKDTHYNPLFKTPQGADIYEGSPKTINNDGQNNQIAVEKDTEDRFSDQDVKQDLNIEGYEDNDKLVGDLGNKDDS